MTDILLIFFALPIAVIIISIALQKILKNPLLVAGVIFAIFLIVTFVIDNLMFLVATIVYTIISFITAFLVCLACRLLRQIRADDNSRGNTCNCGNNDLLTISSNCQSNNNGNGNNNCNNGVTARINVIPNNLNNGNSGTISGCYRRR